MVERVNRESIRLVQTMKFELDYDLTNFLREYHFEGAKSSGETMRKLVTLTSDGKDTQALTCEQYMDQNWPMSGEYILRLVIQIIEDGEGSIETSESLLQGHIANSITCVIVTVLVQSIIEITEQLAWLGCVLRPSPIQGTTFLCTPSITTIGYKSFRGTNFEEKFVGPFPCSIKYTLQTAHSDPDLGQCWHKLFQYAVVAQNFPIL